VFYAAAGMNEKQKMMRRFKNRNWNLLHYKPTSGKRVGSSWDALPEKWIRLVNFPDELGIHALEARREMAGLLVGQSVGKNTKPQ
jgi:hypothetical protein